MEKVSIKFIPIKELKVDWIKCKKCFRDYTKLNKYGFCPICSRKKMEFETDSDRIEKITLEMTDEEISVWDFSLETIPDRFQGRVKAVLSPKVNI